MFSYKPGASRSRTDSDDGQTKHELNSNQQRITALEKEIADLTNLVEGMWNLLRSNTQLDEANLRAAISDVVAMKKHHREKKRGCKNCARFVSAQYHKCIYCGGELVGESESSLF